MWQSDYWARINLLIILEANSGPKLAFKRQRFQDIIAIKREPSKG